MAKEQFLATFNMPNNFWFKYWVILEILSFSLKSQFFQRCHFDCNLGLQQLLFNELCISTMFSAIFLVISFFTETGFFSRLHCEFIDINISGQCSKKLANFCLFLKKEFAELQIWLHSVENMSPIDFTLKLDRNLSTHFLLERRKCVTDFQETSDTK